jgi:hypothetical protein
MERNLGEIGDPFFSNIGGVIMFVRHLGHETACFSIKIETRWGSSQTAGLLPQVSQLSDYRTSDHLLFSVFCSEECALFAGVKWITVPIHHACAKPSLLKSRNLPQADPSAVSEFCDGQT